MARKPLLYPVAKRGKIIGYPNQGTHTLFNNWESDNAIDIAIPYGTPIVAIADGVIGPQIGALRSGDPKLEGLRLHLVTADNEAYYAHLSRLVVKAGQHVKAGQIIGYSGRANGTDHLHIGLRNGNPLNLFGDKAAVAAAAPAQAAQQAVTPEPTATPAAAPEQPAYVELPTPVLQPQASVGIVPEVAYPGQPDLGYQPRQPMADTWRLIANLPYASPFSQQAWQQAQTVEGADGN